MFSCAGVHGALHSFPTRRSSDLSPDGQTVVLTGGFTVTPPPPTLGLAFLGKLRDKVGQDRKSTRLNSSHFGSSYAVVWAKRGARTVTRLELRRAGGGGVWDTDPA